MVPLVSLAVLAVPERPDVARYHSTSLTLVAETEAVAGSAEAIDK